METIKVYPIETGSNVFYSPDRTYKCVINHKTSCYMECDLSFKHTDNYYHYFKRMGVRHKVEYCDDCYKISYMCRNPFNWDTKYFHIHFFYESDDCVASNGVKNELWW